MHLSQSYDTERSNLHQQIGQITSSCNRKDSNDGKEKSDDDATYGGARSASSTTDGQAGDCSTDGAWSNGRRGAAPFRCIARLCIDSSSVLSAKANRYTQRGVMATPSNGAGKCSPLCWSTARTTRLSQVARSNGRFLSVSISR